MGSRPVIPTVGTGFLPFNIGTPPIPVALPVPYVATYASTPGAAPIVTPLMTPELTALAMGAASADAVYGLVAGGAASITVASLRRQGVYSVLLVDSVAMLGATDSCVPNVDSIFAVCGVAPNSIFVRG